MKSPGDGLPPYLLENVVGRTLRPPLQPDDNITFEILGPGRGRVTRPLDGRVAIVTGAFGRLGPVWVRPCSAPARRWSPWTWRRQLAARRALQQTRRRPAPQRDGRRTDRASLEAVRERARRTVQGPAVLVNNAGIDQPPRRPHGTPLEEMPLDVFGGSCDVNLLGTFHAIQVFGPAMRARGRGSIVNIGSLYASVSPDPRFYDHLPADPPFLKPPAYGASKAAW